MRTSPSELSARESDAIACAIASSPWTHGPHWPGALVGEEAADPRDLGERARTLWEDDDRPGAERGSGDAEGCLAEIAG